MINNVIINDSFDNGLERFPDNYFDLTVFSPPYDDVRTYDGNSQFDTESLGKKLYAKTKEGGVCAVVISDGTRNFAKSLSSFRFALTFCDVAGFKLFECCIYKKHGRPGAWWNSRFRVDHEYILIFFKGKRPKYFDKSTLFIPTKNAGVVFHGTTRKTDGTLIKSGTNVVKDTKCRGTVWEYSHSSSERNLVKLKHPATYPDKLVEDLIMCFSEEGNVILDPMNGSGTTTFVANKLNRNFIGIEINRDYCDIAKERFLQDANIEIEIE